MPAPDGQSFVVQTTNPKLEGGLEFSQYAGLVAQELRAKGYSQAQSAHVRNACREYRTMAWMMARTKVEEPALAMALVTVGSAVPMVMDTATVHAITGGGMRPSGGSPFGPIPQVDSYTVYTSHLEMTINRTRDGERLFEGKARGALD